MLHCGFCSTDCCIIINLLPLLGYSILVKCSVECSVRASSRALRVGFGVLLWPFLNLPIMVATKLKFDRCVTSVVD